MDWPCLLAYITGTIDQEMLRHNESLVTENRILEAQIRSRLLFTDAERVAPLAEIGHWLAQWSSWTWALVNTGRLRY
jgi:hypothetical protein